MIHHISHPTALSLPTLSRNLETGERNKNNSRFIFKLIKYLKTIRSRHRTFSRPFWAGAISFFFKLYLGNALNPADSSISFPCRYSCETTLNVEVGQAFAPNPSQAPWSRLGFAEYWLTEQPSPVPPSFRLPDPFALRKFGSSSESPGDVYRRSKKLRLRRRATTAGRPSGGQNQLWPRAEL